MERLSDMEPVDFYKILEYNEKSPSGLIWKVTVNTKSKVGTVAGTLDSYGYWVVRYKGKSYKAHRIILLLHGIEIEGLLVDHMDGNRQNNLKSNLRTVEATLNSRNASKNKLNTSGITGVGICQMKGHTYWYASWYTDKLHYKRFNIDKYGAEKQGNWQLIIDKIKC